MPAYLYKALKANGKEEKGTIEAENLRLAKIKIKEKNLFLIEIKEGVDKSRTNFSSRDVLSFLKKRKKLSIKELAIITRQLGTLLTAGIPLVESLDSLSSQMDKIYLKQFLIDIREEVQGGSSFTKALKSSSWQMPNLLLSMVEAGEASGSLDIVMVSMADYMEAQLALTRKVISALAYPIIVMIFAVIIVIFLFTKVVPSITEVFIKQGRPLPIPTQITIFFSDLIINYWFYLAIATFLIFSLLTNYIRSKSGKIVFDHILLTAPFLGKMTRKILTAKVSSTLATLLTSGVGLLEAIEISKNMVTNVHIRKALDISKEGVKEGRSLAKELSRSTYFPVMLIQMVNVGERTGSLEEMLKRSSIAFEKDVSSTIESLTSILEPVMIIILGGAVFFIVMSILMPMMGMMELVRG